MTVPAIIDHATYEQAQQQRKVNRRTPRNQKNSFLFGRTVTCMACGRSMNANKYQQWAYYRCSNRFPIGNEHARCHQPPLSELQLDRLLWPHIAALCSDGDYVREALAYQQQEQETTYPAAC